MSQRITNGADYFEHFGEIESLAPSPARKRISPLPTVKFTDGKAIDAVMVDSALAPFLQPGRSGRYLLSRHGRSVVVLGAEIDGEGYRMADHEMWHGRKTRQLILTLSFLLGALLFGGIAYFDDPSFGSATLVALALFITCFIPYRASARIAGLIAGLNAEGSGKAARGEDAPLSPSALQAELLYGNGRAEAA